MGENELRQEHEKMEALKSFMFLKSSRTCNAPIYKEVTRSGTFGVVRRGRRVGSCICFIGQIIRRCTKRGTFQVSQCGDALFTATAGEA